MPWLQGLLWASGSVKGASQVAAFSASAALYTARRVADALHGAGHHIVTDTERANAKAALAVVLAAGMEVALKLDAPTPAPSEQQTPALRAVYFSLAIESVMSRGGFFRIFALFLLGLNAFSQLFRR